LAHFVARLLIRRVGAVPGLTAVCGPANSVFAERSIWLGSTNRLANESQALNTLAGSAALDLDSWVAISIAIRPACLEPNESGAGAALYAALCETGCIES